MLLAIVLAKTHSVESLEEYIDEYSGGYGGGYGGGRGRGGGGGYNNQRPPAGNNPYQTNRCKYFKYQNLFFIL